MPKVNDEPVLKWVIADIYLSWKYKDGERRRDKKCEALRYGDLIAIHQCIVVNDHWAVTSVRSGMRYVSVARQNDAAQIALVFHEHCQDAMEMASPDNQNKYMPRWIRPWIEECKRQVGYVDEQPYIDKYGR